MSGGRWNYRQHELKELLQDVAFYMRGSEVCPELSKRLDNLAGVLYDIIHDLDWHFSGDTSIENFDKFESDAIQKLIKAVKNELVD